MEDENPASLPIAPEPCPYPAGSTERILTYARRVEAGYAIFHPDDSKTSSGNDGEWERTEETP